MIGLIRAHFSLVIPSSYKHGHFELHDNVITILPIVICIRPECRNRRDEKHKEQQRKTQTEVFRITYNLSHGQFLSFRSIIYKPWGIGVINFAMFGLSHFG